LVQRPAARALPCPAIDFGSGRPEKARTLLDVAVAMHTTIGMPKHIELAERVRARA
jgi:hypothetical protein